MNGIESISVPKNIKKWYNCILNNFAFLSLSLSLFLGRFKPPFFIHRWNVMKNKRKLLWYLYLAFWNKYTIIWHVISHSNKVTQLWLINIRCFLPINFCWKVAYLLLCKCMKKKKILTVLSNCQIRFLTN